MKNLSLIIAGVAIVGLAGWMQSSAPAYACASVAGGQTGLEASPAFTFNAGPDYYSPDGTTATTPLFGAVGNISIGVIDEGSSAYNENSPLRYQAETRGAQIVLAPCPDGAPD